MDIGVYGIFPLRQLSHFPSFPRFLGFMVTNSSYPGHAFYFPTTEKKEEGKNKYVIVERYDGANGLGFAMIWKAERAGTVALGTGR